MNLRQQTCQSIAFPFYYFMLKPMPKRSRSYYLENQFIGYLPQHMKGEPNKSEDKGKEPNNYGSKIYWDQRYTAKQGERFEWLESYQSLKPYLLACLPKGKDSLILNIACGNSSIQDGLYADGYHHIVNNDISPVVIEQMKQAQEQRDFPHMTYQVMDVREMKYPDQSFDMVLDKATVDTLMCSDNPLINVAKMIEENFRVLRNDGIYFTVSYSGPHNRMEQFTRDHVSFSIEVKELKRLDKQGLTLTNYLYICRKLPMQKKTPEEREQFYRRLKELEEKEYPST